VNQQIAEGDDIAIVGNAPRQGRIKLRKPVKRLADDLEFPFDRRMDQLVPGESSGIQAGVNRRSPWRPPRCPTVSFLRHDP